MNGTIERDVMKWPIVARTTMCCSRPFQVGVIGEASTRDGRRQSRFVRGTADGLEIYTISHHHAAAGDGDRKTARLDLTLNYDVRVTQEFLRFRSRVVCRALIEECAFELLRSYEGVMEVVRFARALQKA